MMRKILLVGLAFVLLLCTGCQRPPRWQKTRTASEIKPLPKPEIKDVYVVSILIDGLGADAFYTTVREGYMPHVKEHLLDRGTDVQNALALFPTVSPCNHTSTLTGEFPFLHGAIGLQWFDRKERMFRNYVGPDYKALDYDLHMLDEVPVAVKQNQQEGIYTIFERLNGIPTVAVEEMNGRGATDCAFYDWSLMFTEILSKEKTSTCKVTMNYLIDLYRQPLERLPRFSFISVYDYDIMAHDVTITDHKAKNVLKFFDGKFGELIAQIKKAGIYDKTYFVFFSDHGMHDLKSKQQNIKKKKLDVGTLMRQAGLIPLYRRNFNYNTYITKSGISYAAIYVADFHDSTLRKPVWDSQPSLQKLRAYPISIGKKIDIIKVLLDTDKLEFILTPESPGVARVFSPSGNARVRVKIGPKELLYSYEPDDPARDPLHYNTDSTAKKMIGKDLYFTWREWLEATAHCEYPVNVPLIANYFESPRAGDILAVAKKHVVLKDSFYDATHGSAEREDMRIPLVFSGPGIAKKTIPTACLLDLVPTWLNLMGAPLPNGLPGKPLPLLAPQK